MADKEKELVFVEYIVKALVDNPDKVQLTRTVDDRGVLLELSVDPDDMGKIIGKGGATAKSIRTLLRVLGAKDEARYNLKIAEPEGSTHTQQSAQSESSEQADQAEPKATAEAAVESEPEKGADTTAEDIKAKAREGIEDLDTDI